MSIQRLIIGIVLACSAFFVDAGTTACRDIFTANSLENEPNFDIPSLIEGNGTLSGYGREEYRFINANARYTLADNNHNSNTVGRYKYILVGHSTSLTFSSNTNHAQFYIKKLEVKDSGKVHFTAGDYWFDEINFEAHSVISVDDGVRIFVNNNFLLGRKVKINAANNNLLMVVKKITMPANSVVKAVLYAEQKIKLDEKAKIVGAMASRSSISSSSSANLTYDQSKIDAIDFSDSYAVDSPMCGGDGSGDNIPAPVLDMRFDEASWQGENSVIDSASSQRHGSPLQSNNPLLNAINSVDGKLCRAADLSSDRLDGIKLSGEVLNGAVDFSIVTWVKANDVEHNMTILSAANSNTVNTQGNTYQGPNEAVFYFDYSDNKHYFHPSIQVDYFDFNTRLAQPVEIDDGQWHQLVWTRKASNQASCFYRDGQKIGCVDQLDDGSALNVALTGLFLGQEQDALGGDFDTAQELGGMIDEVLVFHSVLSSSAVTTLYNNISQGKSWDGQSRVCAIDNVDHFEVAFEDASAATCESHHFTVKACADEQCNSLVDGDLVAKLVPHSNSDDYGGDLASDGVSLNFTQGVANLSLSQSIPQTTFVRLTDLAPTPSSSTPIKCINANGSLSPNGCPVKFENSSACHIEDGILFEPVLSQISGKYSSHAGEESTYHYQKLFISAKNSNATNLFTQPQSVDVYFSYQCLTSGMCDSSAPQLWSADGSQVITLSATTPSALNLSFDSNSKAGYVFKYSGAGKLQLTAKMTVTQQGGGRTKTTTYSGSSNEFIVKPFGLRLSLNKGNTATHTGAGQLIPSHERDEYTRAGKDFVVAIQPVQWGTKTQDKNNDGEADQDVGLLGNAVVGSISGGSIALASQKTAPMGSTTSEGTLTYTSQSANSNGLVNSAASFVTRWSEVGVINLQANLSAGDFPWVTTLKGYENNLGRFIPFYFEHTTNDGSFDAQCDGASRDYTYIGAMDSSGLGSLKYTVDTPSMELFAKNKQGATTKNYQGDFAKLATNAIVPVPPVSDLTQVNSNGQLMVVESATFQASNPVFNQGQYSHALSTNDHFVYSKDRYSKVSPFTASLALELNDIIDSDDTKVKKLESDGSFSVVDKITLYPQGHEIVFGRALLSNAYGAEDSTLAIPLSYQYFDGETFVTHLDNDCENYQLSQLAMTPTTLGNLTQSLLTADASQHTAVKGVGQLPLPAPGDGFVGEVELELTVPSWLRYNWPEDDGSIPFEFNRLPNATATFGRFRSNDALINWRELR